MNIKKGFRQRMSEDEVLTFNSDSLKRAKSRRFLHKRQEARTEEKVAMLFCGDEPTGDIEVMRLIDLFTRNKAFREEFYDAPEGERMYEWRFKSEWAKNKSEGRERRAASFRAAIVHKK